MGCVHTHQKMPAIERWDNPSCVQNVMQKTKEDNQKVGKIGRIINQMPTPRPQHDKMSTMSFKCPIK
jgi:hypothetical protein